MSQELTEQWCNGILERGYYYYLTKIGARVIGFQCYGLKYPYDYNHNTIDSVKEVLAPVPKYDQFIEYYTGNIHWKKECKRLQEQLEEANNQISQLVKKVEQLEEANKLLLDFKSEDPCGFDHQGYCQVHDSCDGDYKCIQKDLKLYFERYGVK